MENRREFTKINKYIKCNETFYTTGEDNDGWRR